MSTGWHKNFDTLFVRLTTSSNIDQFSNSFYCHIRENMCVTKDPTTPQVCHYTTL